MLSLSVIQYVLQMTGHLVAVHNNLWPRGARKRFSATWIAPIATTPWPYSIRIGFLRGFSIFYLLWRTDWKSTHIASHHGACWRGSIDKQRFILWCFYTPCTSVTGETTRVCQGHDKTEWEYLWDLHRLSKSTDTPLSIFRISYGRWKAHQAMLLSLNCTHVK
jgi:hypothetical protein